MTNGHKIYEIPLFKTGNKDYWTNLQVVSVNPETFHVQVNSEAYPHRILTFNDEDFENTQGPITIDLKPLYLEKYYKETELPTEFELPREILTERGEARRLFLLAKGAIWIDRSVDPLRYFYVSCGRLRIKQGENEVYVDKIDVIEGKNVIKVEALELGRPYLELQTHVAEAFADSIKLHQQLYMKLVFRGKSLLDGVDYYELIRKPSKDKWSMVQQYFEDFGTGEKTLNGLLTRYPKAVAKILGNTSIEVEF
jgi:hypothetical protein